MRNSNRIDKPSFMLGVMAGVLLTVALLLIVPFLLSKGARPTYAATMDRPGRCVIAANEATRTWRYATAARRDEVAARWIPFGYTQSAGDCVPATTRQRAIS